MRRPTKKIIVALVAVAAVAVGAGGAYAYWTTAGTGTGTAKAATVAGIAVTQTTAITTMGPNVAAITLAGKFNNTGTTSVYVTNVTVSIASVVKDVSQPTGTCDATDFTITGATMAVGAEIPVGTAVGNWTGATIAFNDKVTNQDPCKLAVVNLAYAST